MEIKVARLEKYDDTTIGIVTVNNRYFGYCLEDTVRQAGVKISGKTAIPAGRYEVVLTMSNRFKRIMPLLLDVPMFEGIRIHGGNSSADTEGCLIFARNHPSSRSVQGTLEYELTVMLKQEEAKGNKSYITILDCLK